MDYRRIMRALIVLAAAFWFGVQPVATRAWSPNALADSPTSLTIGTLEPIANLDPADAGDFFTWELLTHLYTGLTRQKPGTLDYELALAQSHEVSADGLTHTFTIRPDAAFNDGTPITAQTFAVSVSRALALNGRAAAIIAPYVRAAEVDEAGALRLRLNAPVPFMRQLVALPPFFPLHPRVFPMDRLNRTPSAETLASNGVYRVARFELGRVTLTADPTWLGEPPHIATITIRRFGLPAQLREALKARDVDVAWRGLPPDDADNVIRAGGVRLTKAPGLQTFYALIGQTTAPFNDPVVRRGMTHLLDRERAARTAQRELALPLYTLLPSQLAGPGAVAYPAFDAAQGRQVLAEGGYGRFNRVESEIQTSRLMYGELYASGVDALLSSLVGEEAFRLSRFDTEPRTFLDQIERGAFRLMVIGWTPLVPHPDAYLRPLLAGPLASGAHYDNAAVRAVLDRAALSAPEEALPLYEQAQALAAQDVVAIPLWQAMQTLVAVENVESIVIEPNFLLRYDRLKIVTERAVHP